MKFELKIYNTNASDEELLEDLIKVSKELDKQTLTQKEYTESKRNKFHGGTIAKRLGGWNNALQKAGLKVIFRTNVSTDEVIEDLKRVASEISPEKLTQEKYDANGQFNGSTVRAKFGTWNKALQQLGIETTIQMKISELELFKNLETVWIKLGRQPNRREMLKPLSIYSERPYIKNYGSWQKALQAFVDYINSDNEEEDIVEEKNPNLIIVKENGCIHKTKRDPSDRLKLKVMWRDGNVCKLCGVKLSVWEEGHFDHIIPWSKCGETVLENLQILCVKCNLVKGNLDLIPNND